jgi:hypothetical protein
MPALREAQHAFPAHGVPQQNQSGAEKSLAGARIWSHRAGDVPIHLAELATKLNYTLQQKLPPFPILAPHRKWSYKRTLVATMSAPVASAEPQTFLDRWRNAGASERANAQQFLIELADLLGVPHLVAFNAQRAAEESQGQIRYLRPEYQRKKDEAGNQKPEQSNLALQPGTKKGRDASPRRPTSAKKQAWPKSLAERVRLIDETLRTTPAPHTAKTLTKSFARASENDIDEILETLTALGRAAQSTDHYTSVG